MIRRLLAEYDPESVGPGGEVLASMTDIVFLLMIFLLFAPLSWPDDEMVVSTVGIGGSGPARVETVWITARVGPQGEVGYRVDGDDAGADRASLQVAVAARIARARDRVRVVVDAGDGTTFDAIVRAWDVCVEAGVEELALHESPRAGKVGE